MHFGAVLRTMAVQLKSVVIGAHPRPMRTSPVQVARAARAAPRHVSVNAVADTTKSPHDALKLLIPRSIPQCGIKLNPRVLLQHFQKILTSKSVERIGRHSHPLVAMRTARLGVATQFPSSGPVFFFVRRDLHRFDQSNQPEDLMI
jgi:hypothetical protein